MMHRFGILLLGLALASTSLAEDYSGEIQAVESAVDALEKEIDVPGFAVAIAVGDELVWAQGRGYADLENKIPATPRTRFRLASASKLLTATALARLVDANKLAWHKPVQEYVPTFPDKGQVITPYLLAGHLGGIRNYNAVDFEDGRHIDHRHFDTTNEALSIFRNDPLVAAPGTEYRYTTLGYTLLMAVMEGASDTDFLAAL